MLIVIRTIDHDKQRYPTVGDWFYDGNENLHILVSKMKDKRMELAVAFHELIEASLCKERNISEIDVTNFDIQFELLRPDNNVEEPGDHLEAPYHKEHVFATELEKKLVKELELEWREYEEVVNNL